MSGRAWKPLAAIAAAVISVNVVALVVRTSGRGPHGPAHSAFATSPRGLAAYAQLLGDEGHRVAKVVDRPAKAPLDEDSVAFLVGPDFVTGPDIRALRRFVTDGGRLVVAVDNVATWLGTLVAPGEAPTWAPPAEIVRVDAAAHPLAPAPEVAGVRSVRMGEEGAWTDAGVALPVLGSASVAHAAVVTLGRGRIVLLADASPLENRFLADLDDAAFGLDLAGAGRRPVVFVEGMHGFGAATGLRAIPVSWWVALGGLALAAVAFALARGRRLGPPERAERTLPPARTAYVTALADRLAGVSTRADALAPLRRALDRRLDAPADDPDARARAFERYGVPAEDRALLVGAAAGADAELALGRAAARVYAAQNPLLRTDEEERV